VYIAQRAERRRITEAAKKNQDRKIDQMERFVERFRAKNTKAALAKSQMRKIERIERIEITREWEKRGRIVLPPPPKCGAESVRIEQVAFSYDGRANIFENVDFSLMRGEKAALVGYNGTGKTTLLKVMAGVLQPTSGRRALGHQVVVGYQAQEFSDILLPNESVYHVVKSAASPDFPLKDLRNLLGSFGFTGDDVHKSCSVLSGGEKIRLLFARIFVSPPNLLILDEPTTHLDLEAREALQESVRTFEGTVCLVSHDIEFIRATAGTIIEMKPPGIRKFFGDYDYYREKLRRDEDATTTRTETASRSDEVAAPGSEAGKDRRRQRAQARQDMSTKRKALEQSVRKRESEIEELEQEQSQLIAQIENPDNSTDYASINRRLSEIETRLVASNADWDHAVQALDEFMLQYREIHQ
jgi:ATP-binding cassette subfamily F protein 3